MEFKFSFLNGELDKDVFTGQPEGFKMLGKEEPVWKLKKSLYELKLAPRARYAHLEMYLIQ